MMSISTRGRYATRIMVLLASEARHQTMNKFQIAEREAISPAYVQQLLMALRMAGLVISRRGRGGGFVVARPPEAITIADVLRAVEGQVMPAPCRHTGHCDRVALCPTRPLWQKAADLLDSLFASTTIAELLNGGRSKCSGEEAFE
jgi:Rrf2 family protein